MFALSDIDRMIAVGQAQFLKKYRDLPTIWRRPGVQIDVGGLRLAHDNLHKEFYLLVTLVVPSCMMRYQRVSFTHYLLTSDN
ncbi:MAG: hypothetical protein P8K11_10580 [Gammaproteobacteria bacterium]|nr:hypothetical protein [Gammaproteobacteria bacterium]